MSKKPQLWEGLFRFVLCASLVLFFKNISSSSELRVETDITFHHLYVAITIFMAPQRLSKWISMPLVATPMLQICGCDKSGINLCSYLAMVVYLPCGRRTLAAQSCPHSPVALGSKGLNNLVLYTSGIPTQDGAPQAPPWLSPLTEMHLWDFWGCVSVIGGNPGFPALQRCTLGLGNHLCNWEAPAFPP